MPRVPSMPVYSSPTVLPQAVSGGELNIHADQSGLIKGEQLQGLGKALQGTGEAAMDAQTRLNYQENEIRIKQASQAADEYFGMVEDGATQKQGVDVWGMTDKAGKDYEAKRAQFESILTNERQREEFGLIFESKRSDSLRRISHYEVGAREKAQDETDKSGITIETSRAAANPQDNETIDLAREGVNAYLESMAQRKGWTPQIREAAYLDTMTNFHTQVIDSLLDSNPARAQAYYQRAVEAKEIDGAKAAEIHAKIEQVSGSETAYALADQLSGHGASIGAAREAIDKKVASGEITAKVGAAAMSEFKTRIEESKYAVQESQRVNSDQVYSMMLQGTSFKDIPQSLKLRADPKTMVALQEKEKAERTGASVKTDNATWLQINDLLTQDREAFAKTNLLQYADRLSQSDLQSFAASQNKIKTGEIPDAVTWEQQLSTYVNDLGLGGQDNAEQRATFTRAAQDAISAAQKEKGRALTYEERQSVIDPLVMQGSIVRPGFFNFDPEGRAYELRGESDFATGFTSEGGEGTSATLRPEVRIGLIESYKRRNSGAMPSEDQILKAYKNYLAKGGKP